MTSKEAPMTSGTYSGLAHDPHPVLHALAKGWWLVLLRGIAAILFGILAIVWPGITLLTLVILYGAYALADGIFALAGAFSATPQPLPPSCLLPTALSATPS